MRKLLLALVAVAAAGALAHKLAARANTQVHRINQTNPSNQRSES